MKSEYPQGGSVGARFRLIRPCRAKEGFASLGQSQKQRKAVHAFSATLLLMLSILPSGHQVYAADGCPRVGKLMTEDRALISVRLALTADEVYGGLSGVKDTEFKSHEAMLFVFHRDGPRSVSARETYFDIDVFFLDRNLKVVALKRKLAAHPGVMPVPPIDQSATVLARHILEMRSDSPIAQRIDKGSQLLWSSTPPLQQISACIAQWLN